MSHNEDLYHSITGQYEAEYKDKGSRFIAYLRDITNEEAFQQFMNDIKSLHFKARHHCYGFRLKADDVNHEILERQSDDGEPSGTAGRPILNQLMSHELVDTACIVVRYFGGTKLGTSGLIKAYKSAAQYAIDKAEILTLYKTDVLYVDFDYAIMGQLMDCIKKLSYTIAESSFDSKPYIKLELRRSLLPDASKHILATLLNRNIEDIDEETEIEGLGFRFPESIE